MHEIAPVIIEKIKANLSMSRTFGESIRASFPCKQIVGQGSLLNAPLDFERVLIQELGGGAKEDITQILVIK